MRGELRLARETAETFLREAEAEGRITQVAAALRMLGFVSLVQGDLKTAQSNLERASVDDVAEQDGEAQLRFRKDTQATAAACLGLADWHLGDIERARHSIDTATRRANELGHAATLASVLYWRTLLETRRDDVQATQLTADGLLRLAEEYGIKTFVNLGRIYGNWARGRLVNPETGASDLRGALAAYAALGHRVGTPWFHGLLAELEATTHGYDNALTLIDQGLAIAEETGEHFSDPYLYRLRGGFLLKRDPGEHIPAEDAFRAAVAIAKQQGARTYELLASLSLAKLYQATSRPMEAHAVLAPALEGFAPTPEMPEIAEAQALLAACV